MQSLPVTNFDDKHIINLLIFEHACKHDMFGLIKYAVQDEDLLQHLRTDTTSSKMNSKFANSNIQPVFPFILLLRHFLSSLNCHTDQMNEMLSWNKKHLDMIIEILNSTYQQYSYIPLICFSRLMSLLKLLDLIRLLVEGTSNEVIIQRLNLLFPRWTPKFKMATEKHFKIKNPKMLNRIMESHVNCRRRILRFAANDACRDNYVLHVCSSELKKFITESIFYLKQAITSLEKNAGPSGIEKLIEDSDVNLHQSDDPTMQIFLEYLQPGMSEKEFFKLIHSLEPNAESQPDAGFSSCLLPFDVMSDTCSEMVSDLGCLSDCSLIEEENSQDNSVLGQTNKMFLEHPISENSHICLENQPVGNCTLYERCVKGNNVPLTELPNMEIIEDSEEEIFPNSCHISDASYPDIQCFFINVNIKPCLVKLYYDQVVCLNSVEYDIYN